MIHKRLNEVILSIMFVLNYMSIWDTIAQDLYWTFHTSIHHEQTFYCTKTSISMEKFRNEIVPVHFVRSFRGKKNKLSIAAFNNTRK